MMGRMVSSGKVSFEQCPRPYLVHAGQRRMLSVQPIAHIDFAPTTHHRIVGEAPPRTMRRKKPGSVVRRSVAGGASDDPNRMRQVVKGTKLAHTEN
jgi:hypothetical protein